MFFRDSDEPSTEEKGFRGGDETPADASEHPKRQKPSDFDYPKHLSKLESSKTATSLSPDLQHHHLSHLEVPTVSGESGPAIPSTSSFKGLGSPSSIPLAVLKAKIEGESELILDEDPYSLSPDIMGLIETTVLHDIERSGTVTANLDIDWDLLGFMKTQYRENATARLGSVITLSGTVLRAQAATCSEYSQKTWPTQGSNVIMAFQTAIDSSLHKAQGTRSQSFSVSMLFMCSAKLC